MNGRGNNTSDKTRYFKGIDLGTTSIDDDGTFFGASSVVENDNTVGDRVGSWQGGFYNGGDHVAGLYKTWNDTFVIQGAFGGKQKRARAPFTAHQYSTIFGPVTAPQAPSWYTPGSLIKGGDWINAESDVPGMYVEVKANNQQPHWNPDGTDTEIYGKIAAKELKDTRSIDEWGLDSVSYAAVIKRVESVSTGDDDYVSFGYGVYGRRGPYSSTGVFYRGANPISSSEIDRLSGTATYTGLSLGTYHKISADIGGTFESNLHLTADFEAETVEGYVDVTEMEGMDGRHNNTSDKTKYFTGIDLGKTSIQSDGTFYGKSAVVENDGTTGEHHGDWQGGFYNGGDHVAGLYKTWNDTFVIQGAFGGNGKAEYLKYGYWMRSHDKGEDDDTTSSVYFKSEHPVATDVTETMSGTATYTGGSYGTYRSKSDPGNASVEGTFSGTLSMTADFDADTVSGYIDASAVNNLRRDSEDERFTRINLETAGISEGGFSGSANLEDIPSSGSYEGSFFADGNAVGGLYKVENDAVEVQGSFGGSIDQ